MAVFLVVFGVTGTSAEAFAAPANLVAAQSESLSNQAVASYDAELTFGDSGITETTAGSGYAINGTTLAITATGTYRVSGSCSEGSIVVSKGLSDVVLVLDDLTLESSSTAPIVVKKSSTVAIHLVGASKLTDNEDPANETSSDSTVADAFEGACVKVKSESNVTFCGDGSIECVANAKNGIKGGSTASLTFNQSGTVKVSGNYSGIATTAGAANNGIASDGSVVFNQGVFDIDAANDGIKSTPDATDETEGTTIDAESAGAVTINGGTFDIDVDGDGIQADTELAIANGVFDIKTLGGYNTRGTKYNTNGKTGNYTFNADTMSCKGLKASGDRAEEAGTEPQLNITGGSFTLDCADDAIHSDGYATVTGGTFDISTGDDGIHANTSLTLGTEGGAVARDPEVKINYSYEGLEGGTVYVYQGCYYVAASDDGVNAAGGSANGTDPGQGGDHFKPGGGPGGNGGWGGQTPTQEEASADYNIYIYGGDLYVNCDGDGLDSNGGLYLLGGQQAVFSMRSGGDNSAIDADGTISINGATVFTAGTAGVDGSAKASWFGSDQLFKAAYASYAANSVLNAKAGSEIMLSYELPKSANYVMASWPSSVSSIAPTFETATSVTACKGGSQSHSWDSGSTVDGITTYTCSCGATETRSVASTTSVPECEHAAQHDGSEEIDAGYTVTFAGDAGVASINVYRTQDYAGEYETVLATGMTVSRDGDTGAADSTGSGQVNFQVVLNDGYTLSSVTATADTYKNIKDQGNDIYRITKIVGDTTVTITTEAVTSSGGESSGDGSSSENPPSSSDTSDGNSVDDNASASGNSSATESASATIAPATSVAAGTSLDAVDALITSRASDADPTGSSFGKLRLKVSKVAKKYEKLTWTKVSRATKYVVYGNKCGKNNKLVKIATVKGKSYTAKKRAKGTYYKYLVVAVDANNKVVSTSKIVHVATKGGKVTNVKKVKLTNATTGKVANKATIAKGKTLKLKASVTKAAKSLKLKTHRKVKWESSDTAVATVSASGKVKATGTGTCYVYAYAQNGVFAKCKITVK